MSQLWWDEQINKLSSELDCSPNYNTKSRFITACLQYKTLFGEEELQQRHGVLFNTSKNNFKQIVVYKRFTD